MFAYIVRRLLYAPLILIGVNLLTFALFFVVNTPTTWRACTGRQRVTPEAIERWKAERATTAAALRRRGRRRREITNTIFFEKSQDVRVRFRPGRRQARHRQRDPIRMGPSLAIALPTFVLGLFVTVSLCLLLVFFRASYLDFGGGDVRGDDVDPGLFYIIGGQWLVSKVWHLVPISGYGGGLDAWRFLVLPVVIGVISGIGGSARWYRTDLPRGGRGLRAHGPGQGLSEPRRCSATC